MKLYQIDAFTRAPFEGNPAAVCLLDEPRGDAWMRGFAAEMNLSETAFVEPGQTERGLRWFTPTTEVSLCGHATLAAAHALREECVLVDGGEVRFRTKSGILTVRLSGDLVVMDFPVRRMEAAAPCEAVNRLLGATPLATLRREGSRGASYLLELESEDAVRGLTPDFASLAKVCGSVIVTARAERPGWHFVSRFFAPAIGIDEDPVTGSAHCSLAPYWAEKLARTELVGFQASRRSGVVCCRLLGDRVELAGPAVTVFGERSRFEAARPRGAGGAEIESR